MWGLRAPKPTPCPYPANAPLSLTPLPPPRFVLARSSRRPCRPSSRYDPIFSSFTTAVLLHLVLARAPARRVPLAPPLGAAAPWSRRARGAPDAACSRQPAHSGCSRRPAHGCLARRVARAPALRSRGPLPPARRGLAPPLAPSTAWRGRLAARPWHPGPVRPHCLRSALGPGAVPGASPRPGTVWLPCVARCGRSSPGARPWRSPPPCAILARGPGVAWPLAWRSTRPDAARGDPAPPTRHAVPRRGAQVARRGLILRTVSWRDSSCSRHGRLRNLAQRTSARRARLPPKRASLPLGLLRLPLSNISNPLHLELFTLIILHSK
jgi:hypothetical protein